ncbi:MAG: aspartate kinase [Methanobrevibacter sp.]|uniref:aspartate kinase n=1 Tax=Methanobrevibacter sp. TaxID=66852 RepID=UPI0025CF0233|nr:aspartate kinase [Methanobrevibacter sp.]MBQ6098330.1 aspartate kinase [Methanobrevibacter sp.]
MDLIVAKFDGSSLANGSLIKKAAKSVANEFIKGKKVVVVVSAVNKTTDDLIGLSDDAVGRALTDRQKAEIMAMGERTSARIFAASLEALGLKSRYIDPYDSDWPIISDSNFLEARIDYEVTSKLIHNIENILKDDEIPIIPGFLAKGHGGEITTLGRGGSDITAFLLGNCLGAREVVIISDVDGVMSSDPRQIAKAKLLNEISVEEIRTLATKGSPIINPHALKYKDPKMNVKIINFTHGDLTSSGTNIIGPFEDTSKKSVTLYKDPLSIIAIVGESMLEKIGPLRDVTNCLAENAINIYKISAGENSITTFIDKSDAQKAYHILHNLVLKSDIFDSLSLGRDIAMITLVSPDVIEKPSIISDVTEPLRKNRINIIEINSSQTSLVILVDWSEGEKAQKLIKEILE